MLRIIKLWQLASSSTCRHCRCKTDLNLCRSSANTLPKITAISRSATSLSSAIAKHWYPTSLCSWRKSWNTSTFCFPKTSSSKLTKISSWANRPGVLPKWARLSTRNYKNRSRLPSRCPNQNCNINTKSSSISLPNSCSRRIKARTCG